MADYVDLYATGLCNAGAQLEAFEYFTYCFFKVSLQVAIFDAGDSY